MSLLPRDMNVQQLPKIEIPNPKVESLYNKEAVEHLVDQLIKLHNTYNNTNSQRFGGSHDSEIIKGMKTVNEGLSNVLTCGLHLNSNK